MIWKPSPPLRAYIIVLAVVACIFGVILAAMLLATFVFSNLVLNDFTISFYRAGNYVLRGENVYFNSYFDFRDRREYPPYNPIWVVYPYIPFSYLPLDFAEALRFIGELVLLVLLAKIVADWAGLTSPRRVLLLAIAPWFTVLVLAGQVSLLVLTGILLAFFGLRRANARMFGVGLFLLLLKPHIVVLVGLASVLYAWRNRILIQSLFVFFGLVLLASLAQPFWMNDLARLIVGRLQNPQVYDSLSLLPGYPFAQLLVLGVGAALLIWHFMRSGARVPSKWEWSVLVAVSLIGGLHTLLYDWVNLMLPLAILMRQRWGVMLTIALYIYPLVWGAFLFGLDLQILSPTVIPGLIMVALFFYRSQNTLTEAV